MEWSEENGQFAGLIRAKRNLCYPKLIDDSHRGPIREQQQATVMLDNDSIKGSFQTWY